MSRVAKVPVAVPSGVDVQIADGAITVKGPLGTLTQTINPLVAITREGAELKFAAHLHDSSAASRKDVEWRIPVLALEAQRGVGVPELLAEIRRHRAVLESSGAFAARRRERARRRRLSPRWRARRAGAPAGTRRAWRRARLRPPASLPS